MPDATGRPRRKRLSWESRCEIVAKVRLQGISPQVAAATCGVHRATVYRLLARFDQGGWAGLRERRPVPRRQPRRLCPSVEAQILNARAGQPLRPGAPGGDPRHPRLDGRQGAGPRRCLARARARLGPSSCATSASARASSCTSTPSAWGASTRSASGSSRDGIQRSPRRRLAPPARGRRRPHPDRLLRGARRPGRRGLLRLPRARRGLVRRRARASRSSASSPTTATPTAHTPGAICAPRSASSAGAPGPTRPRTNGKAEAFIGTCLREWAYRYAYPTSAHRTRALSGWVRWYG